MTEQTGIDFQHTDGSSGRYYIVETVCAGLALFDHDNDGDEDIYFLNGGALKGTQFETPPRNALYRNEGDWRFTDVTETSGLGHGGHALGVAVADYDGDDDLDVYVTNYGPNVLFRNNGDGTFTDVSAVSGIAAHLGTGMGTVCLDHDNDGDTDIYVANDAMGNFLFCSDGSGKFEEQGLFSGASYNMNGEKMGSMGVGCGDYDNDGLLDLYVTAYQQQFPSLYQNTGDGVFEDVTFLTGAGAGTIHTVTWGNELVDFDNDGDRDLFVALGHTQDNTEHYDKRAAYRAANLVFLNTGDGRFANISEQCGPGMRARYSSRGSAFGDLDNDGDIDVVILNSRERPTLLRNDSP